MPPDALRHILIIVRLQSFQLVLIEPTTLHIFSQALTLSVDAEDVASFPNKVDTFVFPLPEPLPTRALAQIPACGRSEGAKDIERLVKELLRYGEQDIRGDEEAAAAAIG